MSDFSVAACDELGQGCCIYVRNELEYTKLNVDELRRFENEGDFVVCGICVNQVLILSIYIRPMGSTTQESRKRFVTKLKTFVTKKKQFILGGDFNDHGKLFSTFNDNYESPWDDFVELDKVQLLNDGSITRPESGRALDVTFGGNVKVRDWIVLSEGHYSSDHYPIWFHIGDLQLKRYKKECKKRTKKFTLVDWQRIVKDMKQSLRNRDKSLRGEAVIIWWCERVTNCILENSKNSRKTYCPWWNEELSSLKKERSKLRRQKKYDAYKKAHKEFRRVFQRTKRQYYRTNLFQIAESRNPFTELYRFIPSLKKKRQTRPKVQKEDSFRTAMKLGENFAKISSSVRNTREEYRLDEHISMLLNIPGTELTCHELLSALHCAKNKSSSGSDNIGYSVWKRLVKDDEILEDIRIHLNIILQSGNIPEIWRRAIIHPIPKESGGFRPISLLNTLSKIMDRIVMDRLTLEIGEREIQFGCRTGHSTQQAIARLLHFSSMAAVNDEYFLIFSLDLKKAYDRMDVSKLVSKLIKLNVSPYLVRYIDSWLKERYFKVRVNGILSNEFRTTQGLPQGSPLSVALWKIYVSDLPVPDSNCQAFMDDIIFWESGRYFDIVHRKLQDHAYKVEKWLEEHQMLLNSEKTKFLINKDPLLLRPIIVQNHAYFPEQNLRYLGINIRAYRDGPDFGLDLRDVKDDLRRRCSLISRASRWLPTKMCLLFAKSIVLGKLNYYLPFLGAECNQTLDPLVKGLNSAMRFITGAFKSTPIPLLHSRSGIPQLNILIMKAAGNMWNSLMFQPNCLTRDYNLWEANGDNGKSPLGALWHFQYWLELRYIPRTDAGVLHALDGCCAVSREQSFTLFKCEYYNLDLTKNQAAKGYKEGDMIIPQGDFNLWTDGSKKGIYGASGVVIIDYGAKTAWEYGMKHFPIYSSFQIEARAMRDGLSTLRQYKRTKDCKINIFSDSQSLLKHLLCLSLKRRFVCKEVYELIREIEKLVVNFNACLRFYWIPGHEGIGYNNRVDYVARNVVLNEEVECNMVSIPRSRIRKISQIMAREAFKRTLQRTIAESGWENYPPRRFFTISRQYEDPSTRNADIGVFRLRTGHNRLRYHLSHVKLEESPKCRLCSYYNEDGYHLLAECEEILKSKAGRTILDIRMEEGIIGREEYHEWLFSRSNRIKRQRKAFIEALKRAEIDL